jgi:hypothetical protein
VLRNNYASREGFTQRSQWGDLDGEIVAAVDSLGGNVIMTLDRNKFRGEYPDVFRLGTQAGLATQYVYQAMTLLHELGHIYNSLGYGNVLGGSKILDDDAENRGSQAKNQALIFNECAAAIFNKPKITPMQLLLP